MKKEEMIKIKLMMIKLMVSDLEIKDEWMGISWQKNMVLKEIDEVIKDLDFLNFRESNNVNRIIDERI